MEEASEDLLLETCLLAGKIMMESGAEMYRVEDTMSRIAETATDTKGISFVTPTGIFMALQGGSTVKMEQIPTRTINLEKVSMVNDLSREFTVRKISLGKLYTQLRALDKEVKFFPVWLQIVSSAVISGTLMMIFGGVWKDFIATSLIGAIGFIIFYYGTEFF